MNAVPSTNPSADLSVDPSATGATMATTGVAVLPGPGEGAGLVPARTANPVRARQLLSEHGAVILTGVGSGAEAAHEVARVVFGDEILALPPAAPIRPGPATEKRAADDGTKRGYAHTDGYAYGDALPDHFLLLVDHQCPIGGANFLVDGWRLLDLLAAEEATASLAADLRRVPIDQTEPGMRPSLSPVVLTGPTGDPMVRRTMDQRPSDDSARPLVDAAMIGAWHAAVEEAARRATAFRVESGEAVIVDNRRMLHGRETYEDPDRSLWRVWVWTGLSLAIPDGALHSDRRFARVADGGEGADETDRREG